MGSEPHVKSRQRFKCVALPSSNAGQEVGPLLEYEDTSWSIRQGTGTFPDECRESDQKQLSG